MIEEARIPEIERILRGFKQKTTQDAICLEIQRNVEFRIVRLGSRTYSRRC